MCKMALVFDKGFKNVENDLEIWEMARAFGKILRYMGHVLSISETALLSWTWLKNFTNELNIWKMTNICGK